MKELALHIQDIAENSIRAGASLLEIVIQENTEQNLLTIVLQDNGCGMDEHTVQKALDPFYTTKTVRRVGMGLSLFKQAAEQTGGRFMIESSPGKGTKVEAEFVLDHMDRQPLGDMAGVIVTLLITEENMDILYQHGINDDVFTLDTRVIRETLEDVSICEPPVLQFVRDLINDRKNIIEEY
jgi:anti-sigma regulatory factor (Ser/Thr protein kinase)